mmetsp:Transcript_39041/g.84940  ORF Transcript_39041/g.84940 Transcript_39041/m.84940 type:complete len:85 (-) Transcript_39041:386-640(-)
MGKRKSKAPPPTRVIRRVPTTFNCPFCNHEASVDCRLDKVAEVGEVSCRICLEKFQSAINNLSEPIDVYSEWIDECERANEGES